MVGRKYPNICREMSVKNSAPLNSMQRTIPIYQRNVTALTSVLPPKLEAGDISARIGVSWVDIEDYQALTALWLTKPTTTRTVLWYRR